MALDIGHMLSYLLRRLDHLGFLVITTGHPAVPTSRPTQGGETLAANPDKSKDPLASTLRWLCTPTS